MTADVKLLDSNHKRFSQEFLSLFPDEAPEQDDLSHAEFVSRFLDRLQPVVIRGGVDDWPAIDQWSVAYLREIVGETRVRVGTISPHAVEIPYMKASAVLDEIEDQSVPGRKAAYLTKLNIHDVFPALSNDVKPHPHYALPDRMSSPFLPNNLHYPKEQMELLVGGGGLGFPLHYDRGFMHAFIMQVAGEKDAVLIPFEHADSLYRSEEFAGVSTIENIWEPDLDRYPKLATVQGYRATLRAGDLLFIPSGWWHATRLPGVSMGATCNSISRSNWGRYKRYIYQYKLHTSSIYKALVWRLYLEAVGIICRIGEMVKGR